MGFTEQSLSGFLADGGYRVPFLQDLLLLCGHAGHMPLRAMVASGLWAVLTTHQSRLQCISVVHNLRGRGGKRLHCA